MSGREGSGGRHLKGRVVFITGGSRGIGRAIALRLGLEEPAHIVIGYNSDHQAAKQTQADLSDIGVESSSICLDVGRADELQEAFDKIEARCQRLDVFVSNAARTSFKDTMDLSPRSWQRIMDINARAFLLGAQMAAALMRPNGGGRIIAISSLGSRYHLPKYGGLGAAKAAIESLVRYLGVELAPHGINVNVVCGGYIETDSMKQLPDHEELAAYVMARTPSGRLGAPEDLAGAVAFLCSPDSNWVQGQTLVVDGGFSLSA